MAIRPIDLPSAAGLEYGRGDVRHFSEGDAVSVPGISNPTRHLAERDNNLRDKLNEVIGVVNNTEQFVPLPLVRTSLPPNDEVVAANYRIPVGFEARVLNASVSAVPASTDIALIVYYNEGFGGSTGTEVVSTSGEFTGGVQFYSAGEFIVVMRNTGSGPLDFASSVLLTLRPLGAQGTLLVGSTITGPQGLPGPAGPPGQQGPAGSGGTGTPGMIWRGPWAEGQAYNLSDVVSHIETGITSSYLCTQAHSPSSLANAPHRASPYTIWQPLALGAEGPKGDPGDDGAPGTTGEIPRFYVKPVDGTIATGADWVKDPITGYNDVPGLGANSTRRFSLYEVYVQTNGNDPQGMACLTGRLQVAARGSAIITLPKFLSGAGARVDYAHDFIQVNAIANGTAPGVGGNPSISQLCTAIPRVEPDQYDIKFASPTDSLRVTFSFIGMQPIYQPET